MYLLALHQSSVLELLIALRLAHPSTCLLILVISSAPAKLEPITGAYQWKRRRWNRWNRRRGDLGTTGRGGEEGRRWEKGPWNPVMGFAQQLEDYNNIHEHRRGGRERPSSAHQRISKRSSNSGKKTDVMSLIFTQRINNWNCQNDSKIVQRN